MVTVGVDDGSLQADSQLKSDGLVSGLALRLHSSNVPSEPSHGDITVNIVTAVINSIINRIHIRCDRA